MIKNIIFDVGKVLVDFEPEKVMEQLGVDEKDKAEIQKIMFKNPLWNEFDRSILSKEQIQEKILASAPDKKEIVEKLFDKVGDMIRIRDYVMPWIMELKERGYHLYILSNYAEFTYDHTRKELGFLKYMDGVVFSYQCKMIKPEKQIYEYLLNTYELNPMECVFLDDREDNIQAACENGMHGIVFKNYRQGKEDLERLLGK